MAPGTFAKAIRLGGAPHPRNVIMKSQVKTITKSDSARSSTLKNNADGSESSIIGRHRKPIGPSRY